MSHGSKGSKGSKGNKEECCCVEGMAEQLEKFEDFFAEVYEEGNEVFLQGTIRKVIDDQVLHMENVQKLVFTPSNGVFSAVYNDLYISICSITEFAPLFPVASVTAAEITARQNQVVTNLNATRLS